jgi:beta-xylosidase
LFCAAKVIFRAHIHKTDSIYFVSINWENTKNLKLLIPVLFVSVFFRTFAAIYIYIMRQTLLLVLSAVVWSVCSANTPSYTNPILPYDYSDPDVCRIGDTYLMTSSSFNSVPGLQILASKDLVHWEIADAATPHRLPGYKEGEKVLGRFIWAPAIREHKGILYIFYGDPDRGIYCIRSKSSIDKNDITFPLEWEEAVLVISGKGYIDPCPLWDDDGRVWLAHAFAGSRAGFKSVLLIAELNSDALSVKTPSRIVFDGHTEHATCEGPKLYKRNGYYYIMHPAGGVTNGWQVVQRSKSIYGPYELQVTLEQGKTDINGPHQGGWVEANDGSHWFIHFQDKGAAGRIVHMQPIQWVNDWPVMGNNGEPMRAVEGNRDQKTILPTYANHAKRDNFDSTALGLHWQWAGGYIDPRWHYCDAKNGYLRLYSAPANEELMPNMLLQKIPAVAFTATARVRFAPNTEEPMQGAEKAGMIVFGRQCFTLEIPSAGEWLYLRLDMDAKQNGQFFISTNGKTWNKTGDTFHAREGYWTGAQIGFYCTRDNRRHNDAGWMDVDWFEIKLR